VACPVLVDPVLVHPGEVRADPRSRRHRTIRPNQLALALAGEATDIYAYSFICTNLDGSAEMLEYWFGERAWTEERHKDSKPGYGLTHLPSGKFGVNQAWMWSAYLATNLSVFTQTLGRVDADGVRAHAKRARQELFCLPARVLSHSRSVVVRFAAKVAEVAFRTAWENLRALPSSPAGRGPRSTRPPPPAAPAGTRSPPKPLMTRAPTTKQRPDIPSSRPTTSTPSHRRGLKETPALYLWTAA